MKKIIFITLCYFSTCFSDHETCLLSKHFRVFVDDHISSSDHQINIIQCDIKFCESCPSWWFYLGRKQAFEEMHEYIDLKEMPDIPIVDGAKSGIITSNYD